MQLLGIQNLSLGPCNRHGATCILQDALSLPQVNLTISHGGQTDDDVVSPQSSGSPLGSPQIAAAWGNLSAGASSSCNVEQSLEGNSEGASGMEEAASSADAGSVADVSSTADGVAGGEAGVKEDRWEEVTRAPWKTKKAKVLPIKSKGSRSNVGRSGNRVSRLGNACNVLEVPRPSSNTRKSRLGNANNVLEVPRPKAI